MKMLLLILLLVMVMMVVMVITDVAQVATSGGSGGSDHVLFLLLYTAVVVVTDHQTPTAMSLRGIGRYDGTRDTCTGCTGERIRRPFQRCYAVRGYRLLIHVPRTCMRVSVLAGSIGDGYTECL